MRSTPTKVATASLLLGCLLSASVLGQSGRLRALPVRNSAREHGPVVSIGDAYYGNGHGESYQVLVPMVGIGCFGETFPVLGLQPEQGGWSHEATSFSSMGRMPSAASNEQLQPNRSKAIEKKSDKEDGSQQLMSRQARRAQLAAHEWKAQVHVYRSTRSLDLSGKTARDAEPLFWKGYRAYFEQRLEEAYPFFEAATQLNDQDARFWYFRALTEVQLGQTHQAITSLKQAVELHERGLPTRETISLTLERVQGEPRNWIRYALEAERAK